MSVVVVFAATHNQKKTLRPSVGLLFIKSHTYQLLGEIQQYDDACMLYIREDRRVLVKVEIKPAEDKSPSIYSSNPLS